MIELNPYLCILCGLSPIYVAAHKPGHELGSLKKPLASDGFVLIACRLYTFGEQPCGVLSVAV